MSFISPEFAFAALLFLPLFWSLHSKRTLQLWVLTLSSYLLYSTWSPEGAAILLVYSISMWGCGNLINSIAKEKAWRVLAMSVSLILCTSILLMTKYYDFLRQIAIDTLPGLGLQDFLPLTDFVVPAGISFFTFQAVTYLVWRYRAEKAPSSLLHAAVFLSFWPTLFAGPILRAEDFFKNIQDEEFGLPREVPRAIYLILLGMAQKLVFSSWLADTFVDTAFRYPDALDGLQTGAAIWAYSLQIFLDFSGYSLIVTGLALLLGYRVPANFTQPYLARDLREFWRRWHITLSSFIRDYIYIPLGGSKAGGVRTQINLMLAMLISGIWHGANTTFFVWGALHGAGMLVINAYGKLGLGKMPRVLANALTLLYVAFAWVFFRANSCDSAWQLLQQLAVPPSAFHADVGLLCAFSVVFFFLSAQAATLEAWATGIFERAWGWRLVTMICLLSFGVVQLCPSGIPSFIYYRF
ncbi:MBOAT family O-acyltransferase [Uliginosibacterium gangwonense]|uniref:MBOAT family O-acyltransferase n=1 Tax=Uliginosibacterium gangwonense TaxID=392736 RepID=UPI000380D79B|nr:MBOAT family O-acyltransferase [Uliginosibacterium gangwonense]